MCTEQSSKSIGASSAGDAGALPPGVRSGTDFIFIRDLAVPCIVGINPRERVEPQTVLVNIRLACDLSTAALSDRIEDTVNYKTLKDELVAHVSGSAYFLIEKMAQAVASICLQRPGVEAVRVSIDKPGALTGASSVAVEIERRRA